MESLTDCIKECQNKHGINNKYIFTERKYKVIRRVAEKIKILFHNVSVKYCKNMLQQKKLRDILNHINSEFVVTMLHLFTNNVTLLSL